MAALVLLDPIKQLNKTKDSLRVSDILKIRNASDIYYDDQNCYPSSMPFGAKLDSPDHKTIYLNPVPQDPDFKHNLTQRYLYEVDASACPQWNVLFARISNRESRDETTCPLSQMNNCLPPNFGLSGYNYCVVSGTVDCSYITATTLTGLPSNFSTPTPSPTPGGPGATPTPTPTSVPTSTPQSSGNPQATPTPTPISTPTPTPGAPSDPNCSPKNYVCSLGRCNVVASGTGVYCTSNCDGWCQ